MCLCIVFVPWRQTKHLRHTTISAYYNWIGYGKETSINLDDEDLKRRKQQQQQKFKYKRKEPRKRNYSAHIAIVVCARISSVQCGTFKMTHVCLLVLTNTIFYLSSCLICFGLFCFDCGKYSISFSKCRWDNLNIRIQIFIGDVQICTRTQAHPWMKLIAVFVLVLLGFDHLLSFFFSLALSLHDLVVGLVGLCRCFPPS